MPWPNRILTRLVVSGLLLGMARQLRIQYPGAIYHVMNCGDRREDIFQDDKDREFFMDNSLFYLHLTVTA